MYVELTNHELKKAISEYLEKTFKITSKDISFNNSHIVNHKIFIDDVEGISDIEINTHNVESDVTRIPSSLSYLTYGKIQSLMDS